MTQNYRCDGIALPMTNDEKVETCNHMSRRTVATNNRLQAQGGLAHSVITRTFHIHHEQPGGTGHDDLLTA